MRHNKKFNHLGRTASHRGAMLSNMACSLIKHKRIATTLAKAKALRMYVEPILTRAKENTTNNRRVVFAELKDKLIIAGGLNKDSLGELESLGIKKVLIGTSLHSGEVKLLD